MSDETPGVTQGALPPRDGQQGLRATAERPAVRLTQVAEGQYVLTTSQTHGVPALAQLSSGTLSNQSGGITRIISISPSRVNQSSSPLRPSLANQSIVNVLTKPRTNSNVRLQLFKSGDSTTLTSLSSGNLVALSTVVSTSPVLTVTTSAATSSSSSTLLVGKSAVKRSHPSSTVTTTTSVDQKETYAAKLQRVMNHRIVRSKLIKEKYNEHLMESYFLETGGNILELYNFAKRAKSHDYINFLKENAIDPQEYVEDEHKQQVLSTPSATAINTLPGSLQNISSTNDAAINTNTIITTNRMVTTAVTSSNITATVSTTNQSSTVSLTTAATSVTTTISSLPSLSPPQTTMTTTVSTTTQLDHSKTTTNLLKIRTPINHHSSGVTSQEQIVEKAKQEAYVVQRIADLQKEGLWSEKRLPKVQEMHRNKAHWDFLLEEMVWLAADFAQERKWKKAAAKKCARMVQKHFQDKALAAQKAEKAQEQNLKRIAAFCAKEIRNFWSNVEKLVEYKQNAILEEKRKKALDQQLSFIVDQTEKYSQLLAEGMNRTTNINDPTAPASELSSRSASRAANSDDEFQPDSQNSTDDEETIEQAEAAIETAEQNEEIAALQRESQMDLDDFLKELPKDYLENRDKIQLSDTVNSSEEDENEVDKDKNDGNENKSNSDDDEFTADSNEDADDDEDTIQEQELVEGEQDHQQELDDLKAENDLSIEELRKKYSGPLPQLSSLSDNQANENNSEIEDGSDQNDNDNDDDDNDIKTHDSGDEYQPSDDEEEEDDMDRDDDEEEEEEEGEDDEDIEKIDHSISENDDIEMLSDDGDDDDSKGSEEIGLKSLLDDSNADDYDGIKKTKTDKNNDLINDAAAIAESIQPKGNTLSSTTVSTKVPFLLKFPLREYQHIGLDWLVTMYERKLNGILADEMGLGKTIQTIALLAHLACEKENWGPHLIVVPTSVMLNWEMECKKWSPAFKILTYYGTQKERKLKRMGWTKPNAFHICITSYKLVIQDHQSFRRKKWKYLILDEAQNIKNFKSQRWQLLLNFQTQQRLLLTGTPLQNNLMELWSLMHFLMPNVFQSHREFKEWFSNPVTGMIEGNAEYNESIIKRLHKVLRPFLLRRLKSEVEKQMPKKYEHVILCRLSKRQRFLYDDYMSRAKTKETLATGNLLSVINVLMQLRKVCNHPNLFEVRPTISPFLCDRITMHIPSLIYAMLEYDVWNHINLLSLNLDLVYLEFEVSAYQCYRMSRLRTPSKIIEMDDNPSLQQVQDPPPVPPSRLMMRIKKGDDSKLVKNDKKDVNNKNLQTTTTTTTAATSMATTITTTTPSVKFKLGPQYGMQLIQQQGIVKAIPVNISQPLLTNNQQLSISSSPSSSSSSLSTSSLSTSSILKASDKISASFAQLVQTSTGKHLLLTSNPNISANIPVSATGAGGQKLTLLSKQPVLTSTGSVSHQITKAIMKIQLTSVTALTTNTTTTVTNSSLVSKSDVNIKDDRKTVGSKFIEQLYANQASNNLDVRWNRNENHKVNDIESSSDEIELGKDELKVRLGIMARLNEKRCSATPIYGEDLRHVVTLPINKFSLTSSWCENENYMLDTKLLQQLNCLKDLIHKPIDRIKQFKDICDRFIFYVPAVRAPQPEIQVWHPPPSIYWKQKEDKRLLSKLLSKPTKCLHHIASAMVTQFPDPRLIQYDCGKLQILDKLLRKLKSEGHRVLIFTQMTKMLDVLEAFLNFHGHIYLRLDGTTKVDQRQLLMERFNGDTRIFAFILSTRSGGIGVNLTGADTVIFYDSDWNPTMDAQAQDRCHRIGQTRDVHIYRLVSERTIEENILKKANQKRLLGDLAIEGGNFTTAYFKSSTIQDLFNIDSNEENARNRLLDNDTTTTLASTSQNLSAAAAAATSSSNEDKAALGALESALAACEDDQDVQAARTAKAEAVADLAEFDENIPLDDQEKEPEMSKAEQEIDNVMKKLSPIEKYAIRFIEETESAWSAEQLAAAEREIEEQKREWEENRLAAMREEEERRARQLEEENDLLTFSREDASNQIWVSDNTVEQMPMWCPPTPPQQDTDVYIDHTMSFLYDMNVMSESQLPPIYVKKEAKRTRHEAGLIDSRRPLKIQRKDDSLSNTAPRSLFHSAAILKMKRDLKLQKYRGMVRTSVPIQPGNKTNVPKPLEQPLWHDWTIHEDMAILKVIQSYQGLPLNLMVLSPGHTPNWDFVADYVNTVSITYRSPKQCRHRYETVLMLREEGKQIFDNNIIRKKKNKSGLIEAYQFNQSQQQLTQSQQQQEQQQQLKTNKPMRTSQLYAQDNNLTFSQIVIQRHDALKSLSTKRQPVQRQITNNPLLKNPKHVAMLNEYGIDLDHPVMPVEVAARRAERIAREKKPMTLEQQQQMAARLQLLKSVVPSNQVQQQQQQQQQQQNNLVTATTISGQIISPSVAVTAGAAAAVVSVASNQVTVTQQTVNLVSNVATSIAVSSSSTPTNIIRSQRIITSPMQGSTVVSVSGLSPAQIQAAANAQRLIVSATSSAASTSSGQNKTEITGVGGGNTISGAIQAKSISSAQLQLIRQQAASFKQHLRLQTTNNLTGQNMKNSTVTIGGGPQTVVQFTQAQQPKATAQFIRQGTVTVGGNSSGVTGNVTGGRTEITRTVTESEITQILKKRQLQQQQLQQQQQQQQKTITAVTGGNNSSTSGTSTIQGLPSQVFAQAVQQSAGTSGTQVATLVKAVSNTSGVPQTVTIPVSSVTLGSGGKTITPTIKGANAQQLRQIQIQQQLLSQKKLNTQKLNIAQVGGKNNVPTQLIVGPKPLSTAMTVQQFTQVMRTPLGLSTRGPVVLAKGTPRVIPVNTSQGTKQTIQVVAATSQALNSALRPQSGTSTLTGALTGLKVQSQGNSQAQQAILSQVSAALQNQTVAVRQGSPVRLQTASGASIVAVTVQPTSSNIQQQSQQPPLQSQQQQQSSSNSEQVSRFIKK